ncbi:unnamed protein product [Brachionus calyciflorus]|uniref:Uncharacterized protein n=1 Tax=Brachionus calyciflorus TaxID=104777 RepID=A0A814LTR4_9BILA|nr:unnamed protein product [Brachionus calyciflorus]
MTQSAISLVSEFFSFLSKDHNNRIPNTHNKCRNNFDKFLEDSLEYERQYYCSVCNQLIILKTNAQRSCELCNNRLQIFFNLNIETQIRRLFKRDLILNTPNNNDNIISDVTDGIIYEDFLKDNFDPINKKECFSFTLSTDGISVCSQSGLSIWPIMLGVNEVHSSQRLCLENIIIAVNYNSHIFRSEI